MNLTRGGVSLKQKTEKILLSSLLVGKYRIAVVAGRFNGEICEGLIKGAKEGLSEAGLNERQVDIYRVPGAFEIPLAVLQCAKSRRYNAVVALGAVIRGDTPHFDYVCRAVTDGLREVSLSTGMPVGFGVITTNNLDQARERSAPDRYNKGREAALAAVEMIVLLKKIKA